MKPAASKIKILLVESQPLTRLGLRTLVASQADMEIVGETASGADGINLHQTLQPDVTLYELRMPDVCGVDAVTQIKAASPDSRVLICSAQTGDAEIARSLKNGANGFVLKDATADEILKAIRTVAAGKRYVSPAVAAVLSENLGAEDLTGAERRIIAMIVAGNSNKEIARALSITENTVKTHLKNIFDKLDARDRTSAAMTAIRRGIVRVDV